MYENRRTWHNPFPDAIIRLGVPQPETVSLCLVISMDFPSKSLSNCCFKFWPLQQLMAMSSTV